MKDLLVYVADADAQGFVRAVLQRPQALGIRAVDFHVDRHPQRDAGMMNTGAELMRLQKGQYGKVLLILDHHGSGRDHKQNADAVGAEIQEKLDTISWSGNSFVSVLVPELEQWLWFCENALATHYGIDAKQLEEWVADHAAKLGLNADTLKTEQPKELFEYIVRERLRRTISPGDFEKIGDKASVKALMECSSFRSIVDTLRLWFSL